MKMRRMAGFFEIGGNDPQESDNNFLDFGKDSWKSLAMETTLTIFYSDLKR